MNAINDIFNFSKNYDRYVYEVMYKTVLGKFKQVKGLPVYETYEQAEAAAKRYAVEKYYIHRGFIR